MTTVRYEGERLFGEPRVFTVDEEGRRSPLEHQVYYHSPAGFDWGYGGSGPAELALNLLLDALEPAEIACTRCKGKGRYRGERCYECRGLGIADAIWRAHHDFKWHFIAGLPEVRWSLERADVVDWWRSNGARAAVG